MPKGTSISIQKALDQLSFLKDRKPETSSNEARNSFSSLSEYRDGEIYVMHYAGNSEWERHPKGDEIVFVIDGETSIVLLSGGQEESNLLKRGELLVVPQNVWHRFETPKGVKIMTVTPQPTDHSYSLESLENV